MRRDRTSQTLDLFSAASSGQTFARAKETAKEQRHILPKDLPNAVKHLTDEELNRLLAIAFSEARRRGRAPSSDQTNTGVGETATKQSSRVITAHGRQAEAATFSLTRGQVNAVRAAFKAGIKPSLIARQFGISRSDVQKAVASDPVSGTRA